MAVGNAVGMRAGSHEVQIFVMQMPVGGPQVGRLRQPYGTARGLSLSQVYRFRHEGGVYVTSNLMCA